MAKQYQVNSSFNKKQYIVLLKYCQKHKTTPYKLIKIYLIRKCNLPGSLKAIGDRDIGEQIKELERVK